MAPSIARMTANIATTTVGEVSISPGQSVMTSASNGATNCKKMAINSFRAVYTSLTGEFFRTYCGTPVVDTVRQFHVQIVDALERKDSEGAVRTMSAILKHGEAYLRSDK